MTQVVLINAQTAAVAAGEAPGFSVPDLGFAVGLKSSGLSGSEVINIFTLVNGVWVDTGDDLTVANPHRTVSASGTYTVSKASTGAVTVVAG